MSASDAFSSHAVVTEHVVVVSADCHVGPRLIEDLRPYCPSLRLAEFDAFAAETATNRAQVYAVLPQRAAMASTRNRQTTGHYDSDQRLRDLDFDGVAAEIIFHGSQNEEPMPWGTSVVFLDSLVEDRSLVALGRHIYNEWLADFCALAPARRVGLAQLPMWDVDAAVAELEWAYDRGLRSVNFPAPRVGVAPYNDRSWDPFWGACQERSMPLTTHSGAGDPAMWTGRESTALMSLESGGWLSRRALHQMIFGGVFERFPDLTLVLTEQPGDWWPSHVRELDSVWDAHSPTFIDQVPRRPSEYGARNVAIGSSFLARFEAEAAVRDGYADMIMWGSDYPHMEGTFQNPLFGGEPSIGRVAMRYALSSLDPQHIRAMAGGNAVRVYGLDNEALVGIAQRIGAPTMTELMTPALEIPQGASRFAFRQVGAWS